MWHPVRAVYCIKVSRILLGQRRWSICIISSFEHALWGRKWKPAYVAYFVRRLFLLSLNCDEFYKLTRLWKINKYWQLVIPNETPFLKLVSKPYKIPVQQCSYVHSASVVHAYINHQSYHSVAQLYFDDNEIAWQHESEQLTGINYRLVRPTIQAKGTYHSVSKYP